MVATDPRIVAGGGPAFPKIAERGGFGPPEAPVAFESTELVFGRGLKQAGGGLHGGGVFATCV